MKYLIILIPILVACSILNKTTESSSKKDEKLTEKSSKGIEWSYIDNSISYKDDFFKFVNGNWLKKTTVPATESRWGSFNELQKNNIKKLTNLLEEMEKTKSTKGDLKQILGDYYSSFKDSVKREKLGVSPIYPLIDRIQQMSSPEEINEIVAEHHKLGISSLFSIGVSQDFKNPEKHILFLFQGGIGLPNKQYYTELKGEIMEPYMTYMEKVWMLAGMGKKEAKEFSHYTFKFEEDLAKSMMSPVELRDPNKIYNKYAKKDIIKKMERFNISKYYDLINLTEFDSLIIGQTRFMASVEDFIKSKKIQEWKYYLIWKVLNHYASYLNKDLVEANFDFYGRVLQEKKEMKPVNERAIVEITNSEIGELLGKAFVARYFSDEASYKINVLVDNLTKSFEQQIQALDWMSDATKQQAIIKLKAITRKLGYPTKWTDFSSLDIKKDNYVSNVNALNSFSFKKNISKLNKPVDKNEWEMPAHMVNAYYNPLNNEIVFPAGIMQAPFFDPSYEDAVNYARIGMVIGHELTHGFDDMGSMFGPDGSMQNWWKEEDLKKFKEKSALLGETYAKFCPFEGHCVNPQLTMGENIADLGGIKMAFYAYKNTEEFQKGEKINNYSPEQRFFIAYAQLWKIKYKPEYLKEMLLNDPHSPGMYRVNGILMNMPEFFDAFDIPEGSPMRNPKEKIVRIW